MLPIFIHHELNEKPQTGGSGNQAYVKTCISQARKFNPEVILFGDESNKTYCEKWVDASKFSNSKWKEFLSVFENFSTYPDAWAKGIFKRFFIFEEYMKSNKIEKCVILDSDVLVWCDFEKLSLIENADVALEINEDQRLKNLPFENQYRWGACCGVSTMTLEALSNFTEFCIETYRSHKSKLLEKWNIHLEYHLSGGICEMSLLYLWVKECSSTYNIVNLGIIHDSVLPVVVTNGTEIQYQVNRKIKVMNRQELGDCLYVEFKEGMPYVYDLVENIYIKALSLHFGGKSKIFMDNFAKQKTYSGRPLLDWYYWVLRGKVSKIKNDIIKKHK